MSSVTIITGASRGIGAATAIACAKAGHKVGVNYINHADAANRVAGSIRDMGGEAITLKANTAIEAEVINMFEEVENSFGAITALVNNAGIYGPRMTLAQLPDSDIERVLDINVRGYFLCAREAIKRMSKKYGGKGGAIVNVSSGSAKLGDPGAGVIYAASKGAVNSLTIGLSQEVANEGIRVNAVAPGLTNTDMPEAEKLEEGKAIIPMGRVGQPEEVAKAILWLLSEEASYVAGANIRVAGGRL